MKYLIIFALIILGLAMIVYLQSGFMFIMIGLLPTLVAYYADTLPGKHVFKCVMVCNLSGMVPTFADVAVSGSMAATLQTFMGDAFVWFIVYASAGGGYLLLWTCRTIARVSVVSMAEAKIASLQKEQEELIEEWGPLIKKRHA